MVQFSMVISWNTWNESLFIYVVCVLSPLGTIATTVVGVLEHLGPEYATSRDATAYTMFFIPNFAFSHGIYRFSVHTSEIYRWINMEDSQKKYTCSYSSYRPPPPCCGKPSFIFGRVRAYSAHAHNYLLSDIFCFYSSW